MMRVKLVIAASVLLSGCTARQSTDQYRDNLQAAVQARTTAHKQLAEAQDAAPDSLTEAADLLDTARNELDQDAPPRSVQAAHVRMVEGMEELARILRLHADCAGESAASSEAGRACRAGIGQDVLDEIRNDFSEADSIYLETGFDVRGLEHPKRTPERDVEVSGGDEL